MFLHQEGSLGNFLGLVEQQEVVDLPRLQFCFICISQLYIVVKIINKVGQFQCPESI